MGGRRSQQKQRLRAHIQRVARRHNHTYARMERERADRAVKERQLLAALLERTRGRVAEHHAALREQGWVVLDVRELVEIQQLHRKAQQLWTDLFAREPSDPAEGLGLHLFQLHDDAGTSQPPAWPGRGPRTPSVSGEVDVLDGKRLMLPLGAASPPHETTQSLSQLQRRRRSEHRAQGDGLAAAAPLTKRALARDVAYNLQPLVQALERLFQLLLPHHQLTDLAVLVSLLGCLPQATHMDAVNKGRLFRQVARSDDPLRVDVHPYSVLMPLAGDAYLELVRGAVVPHWWWLVVPHWCGQGATR